MGKDPYASRSGVAGPAVPDDDLAPAGRAQRGNRNAFAQLVRRHQDRLFRFLLRLTGSRDDALGLVQDAFLRVWQAMPYWRPEAKFSAWLFGIARNAAIAGMILQPSTQSGPRLSMHDMAGHLIRMIPFPAPAPRSISRREPHATG